MELQVSRWGNSLALRIPVEIVRRLGLQEGSTVQVQVTVDGALTIKPAQWSRKAFAAELREALQTMPMGESVMDEMRREARY
jgi:antitoxin MazE